MAAMEIVDSQNHSEGIQLHKAQGYYFNKGVLILLMEEILHQLI